MRTVALSFAREFWSRQRWLMMPALLYLAALVVLVHVVPAGTLDPRLVAQLSVVLLCVLPSCLAVYSYGDKADVLARESAYPRRSFTLPLTTSALVGWPMALGTATVAGFWLATSGLVLRAVGLPVPLLWPALFAAGLLAWTQALMWVPLPLPVLRVALIVPALSGLIAAAILGAARNVSPAILALASAGLVPLAYAVAVAGVARARRGDVPVLSWPRQRAARATSVGRPPFASPAAALAWLEWRSNLFFVPLLVLAMLLLAPMMLLVYLGSSARILPLLNPGLASFPLMMALIAGAGLGSCHAWARHQPAIPPFLAARPVTSGTMLAVKLRSAVFTTISSWALLVLALAVVVPLSSAGEEVRDWIRVLFDNQGPLRGTVWLLLIVVGLPALTWKMTIDQFWIGLAGSHWANMLVAIGIPIAVFSLLAKLGTMISRNSSWRDDLLAALPWLVGAALALKLTVGAFVARELVRRELIARRSVAWFAAGWLASAVGLVALALWLLPPDFDSPLVLGIAAVVLGLPLVRLGLMPLALDWNRHR